MERAAPARRRRLTAAQLLIGLFAFAVLLGVAGGLASHILGDRHLIQNWLLILSMPVAVWVTVLWWRRLDEAAREAHKWAWYWGATVGIVAVAPLLVFPGPLGAVSLAHRLGYVEPGELMSFGMVVVLMLQIVGYGVAWAAWWLKRR